MAELYEMKFTAVGVVKDADGNIVSETPVEATQVVTEEQMTTYLKGQGRLESTGTN